MTVLVLTSWSTINVAKDQNVFACHVLQLQLESPYACASIATRCLLHFQTCGTYREPVLPCLSANSAGLSSGDVVHRGMSQFLLAQASLLTTHQDRGHLEKQGGCIVNLNSVLKQLSEGTQIVLCVDVMEVIPVLEEVVTDFQKASATGHLHKAALLLVNNV